MGLKYQYIWILELSHVLCAGCLHVLSAVRPCKICSVQTCFVHFVQIVHAKNTVKKRVHRAFVQNMHCCTWFHAEFTLWNSCLCISCKWYTFRKKKGLVPSRVFQFLNPKIAMCSMHMVQKRNASMFFFEPKHHCEESAWCQKQLIYCITYLKSMQNTQSIKWFD